MLDEKLGSSLWRHVNWMSQVAKYAENQRALCARGAGVKLLRQALQRLPKLEAVDVACFSNIIGAKEVRTKIEFFDHLLYHWDLEGTLPILFEALKELRKPLREFQFGRDDRDFIQHPGLDLRIFKYEYSDPIDLPPIIKQQQIWKRLDSLDLDQGPHSMRSFARVLSILLEQCPLISSLSIGARETTIETPANAEIAGILKTARLPRLRKLGLSRITLTETTGMIDFVKTHCQNLQVISLSLCPDWGRGLKGFRSLEFPALYSFSVVVFAPRKVNIYSMLQRM